MWGDKGFYGPYPISMWNPPHRAAVYAIMTKPDPLNMPSSYRILCFGESDNLSERRFYRSHHKFNCLINYAGSEENLYIGIHLMPDSTLVERKEVESNLIDRYKPVCNY